MRDYFASDGSFIDRNGRAVTSNESSQIVIENRLAVSGARVDDLIREIRGEKVIIDSDLARIYGVSTSRLNEQVKRNLERFPEDFAFRLTAEEFRNLKSQNATSRSRHGGRRKVPLVFTEHGAIMAANVLNSNEAVQMSVFVVRAFVKLRRTAMLNKELAGKLLELERKVGTHDQAIASIIAAIRGLMTNPEQRRRAIGFTSKQGNDRSPKPSKAKKR